MEGLATPCGRCSGVGCGSNAAASTHRRHQRRGHSAAGTARRGLGRTGSSSPRLADRERAGEQRDDACRCRRRPVSPGCVCAMQAGVHAGVQAGVHAGVQGRDRQQATAWWGRKCRLAANPEGRCIHGRFTFRDVNSVPAVSDRRVRVVHQQPAPHNRTLISAQPAAGGGSAAAARCRWWIQHRQRVEGEGAWGLLHPQPYSVGALQHGQRVAGSRVAASRRTVHRRGPGAG